MGIVNSFEKKIFFNWSRHLWNFLGVSGFIAFSTGVILFLNSTFIESPKSKENYFGKEYISQTMINDITSKIKNYLPLKEINGKLLPFTYEEWLKSDKKGVPYLTSRQWAEVNNKPYPISKDGSKLLSSSIFAEYSKYRKKQFNLYIQLTSGIGVKIEDKDEFIKNNILQNKLVQENNELISKRNQQNRIYENYKKEVEDRNDIKYAQRLVSPLVIGYGLVVVASSSLSSALLSIERNTRKKED